METPHDPSTSAAAASWWAVATSGASDIARLSQEVCLHHESLAATRVGSQEGHSEEWPGCLTWYCWASLRQECCVRVLVPWPDCKSARKADL